LRELVLTEGKVVFDPKLDRHHHLIDEDTGTIHDIPWEAVPLTPIESVESFAVHDMQIVMRGRRKE
jgi:Fe2+ or Zn2+ uptake regulation protein